MGNLAQASHCSCWGSNRAHIKYKSILRSARSQSDETIGTQDVWIKGRGPQILWKFLNPCI